jgi:hypothetical protein
MDVRWNRIFSKSDVKRLQEETRIQALKRLGVSDSRGAMAILLDPSTPSERRTMGTAAVSGPVGRNLLLRVLELIQSGSEVQAWDAASVLVGINSRSATKHLVQVVKQGPHEHNRRAAIHVLQMLRDPRSITPLVRTAKDRKNSEGVRAAAFDALSWFVQHPTAFRALVSGLRDKSPNIRLYCLDAVATRARDRVVRKALADLAHDNRATWEGYRVGERARKLSAETGVPSTVARGTNVKSRTARKRQS